MITEINKNTALSHSCELDGVRLSQHFKLSEFLKICEHTDQLLTGNGWLHISWNPLAQPRHYVRIGYYK